MDSFGELNFINITIEKNKELKVSEDGKLQKRYQKIMNFLDPKGEFELYCAAGSLKQGNHVIAQIRTYRSDTGATGFSLKDADIENYPAFCVVFDSKEEIDFIYYIGKGIKIERKGGSQTDVSGSKLKELCQQYSEECKILKKDDSFNDLEELIENSLSEEE